MASLQETIVDQRVRPLTAQAAASVSTTISIVMPVFNEVATIEQVIDNVRRSPIRHELIIIDDGSTDGTEDLLQRFAGTAGVRILRKNKNCGKGAALISAFALTRGEIIIVQDADLEYDPAEFGVLTGPILNGEADVVYGSRFLAGYEESVARTSYWANRLITALFNQFLHQQLTDVETCHKAFRRATLEQVAPSLVENGFGIEIELAARIAKLPGVRVVERAIRYCPRTRSEGKKIRWTDGLWALWCIYRYR